MFKILNQSGEEHPNAIPGLVCWYDASEPGTLSREDIFASKFFDKAPGGHIMYAADESCPKILQSRFKGKTVLRFETQEQCLKGEVFRPFEPELILIGVANGQLVIDDWSLIDLDPMGVTIPNPNFDFKPIDLAEVLVYELEDFNSLDLEWVKNYLIDKWELHV